MIAYRPETQWGDDAPGPLTVTAERQGGLRPYYRRTQPNGSVAVFFRDQAKSMVLKVVVDPSAAALLPSGHTYTVETT